MANKSSEAVHIERTNEEDTISKLPQTRLPKEGPVSPMQEQLRTYTSTLLSPIPEDVMRLREEYRRSSAGSAPKTTSLFDRNLSNTVTKWKSGPLSRSKAPAVYVPSGSVADILPSLNDRAPMPFTPTGSQAKSIKGDKNLPLISELCGSPIAFNALANFDDPFIISSTPDHAGPANTTARRRP
ncbi:hypothetical protein FKW77_000422 [Venturia effusa]|uniref:Uncharacterized protein n=1 Tax=Venturia effusa TaxID=50376 RepID=A0A517L4R6_9PEZI|nr:hypothetical protein FKW77_000422 [Venturia effusa]